MNGLLRILVTGDINFNNYFLAYPYLKELIPPDSIIVSCGDKGTDAIAETFANSENMVHESYPIEWDNYGKRAPAIRNTDVVKLCDYFIIFWDGTSTSTKNLLDIIKKKKSNPTIIYYKDTDIIKPHSGRVVHIKRNNCDVYCGRGSVYGNPYFLADKKDREFVILKYTDYLIKNYELVKAVLKLKPTDVLGCFCSPNLCHCDILAWLVDTATDELKLLIAGFNKKKNSDKLEPKKPIARFDNTPIRLEDFAVPGRLYSKHGLPVAESWEQLVDIDQQLFIEIPENKIIKSNLHLSKQVIDLLASKDEDEVVSIKYHTNEIKNIPITYYKVSFADSPYRDGYWYVNVKDVKVDK